MVSLGRIPTGKPIPGPELSYLRLFQDNTIGWQSKGQYAIWTGASIAGGARYRLLERFGKRVGAIERADGSAVLHRIPAGTSFMVEGLMGYWLALAFDAIWLDTPCPEGRYALLAISGLAGNSKEEAVLDWVCPRCGESISPRTLEIRARAFDAFLKQAEVAAAGFDADLKERTCSHCEAVHPNLNALMPGSDDVAQQGERG